MKVIPCFSNGQTSEGERKDCAVRALANASDMPYDEAHELLAYYGRVPRSGTLHQTLIDSYRDAGFTEIKTFGTTRLAYYFSTAYREHIKSKEKGITLENFCKKYNKGRYIVVYLGHALAVVDGKIIDKFDNPANKRIGVAFSKPQFN